MKLAVAALIASSAIANATTENHIDLASADVDLSNLQANTVVYDASTLTGSDEKFTGRPFSFNTRMTLSTSTQNGHIVLDDTWEVAGRVIRTRFLCNDDPTLSIIEGSMSMEHARGSIDATIVRSGSTLQITSGSKTREFDAGPGLLTQAALMRIVPRLPKTPGAVYAFDAFCPAADMRPKTPEDNARCTITCNGQHVVELEEGPTPCTEFVANFEGNLTFLVDAQGQLRKLVSGQGRTEMVMTDTINQPALATADDEDN